MQLSKHDVSQPVEKKFFKRFIRFWPMPNIPEESKKSLPPY
jgi:hypothetical protein